MSPWPYFFFWNTKLAQQLLGILQRESPQVSVCPCYGLFDRLWLLVILKRRRALRFSVYMLVQYRTSTGNAAAVAAIFIRESDLLLSGLVGHFDIRETLSTACRISHTCHLQQTFPLHGRDEGSCRVPGSRPHLRCVR